MTRYYLRIYLKNSKNPSAYIIAFRYIYIHTYKSGHIEKGEQNLTDALAIERKNTNITWHGSKKQDESQKTVSYCIHNRIYISKQRRGYIHKMVSYMYINVIRYDHIYENRYHKENLCI